MQTKRIINSLLSDAGIRPRKSLGQHFLIDFNLMHILIESANIQQNDIVLEVGCGTGSLTEELAARARFVVAVEIDNTLAAITRNQLAEEENVKVINADILAKKSAINSDVIQILQSVRKRNGGRILLVANLPYNAASPLMFNLVAGPVIADAMYVTVQKEVAQRIAAAPGNKDYGTLSVLLQAAGEVRIIRSLPPSSFWPRPKVDSVMLSFVRDRQKAAQIENIQIFTSILNLFMQHRRKMLKSIVKFTEAKLNNIQNWTLLFEQTAINPESRPADINPAKYVELANTCPNFSALK